MTKNTKRYSFAAIATDVVIFTVIEEALHVLLIKMNKRPFEKCWAAPGGLVKPDESVDAGARRQLATKTGVKDIYLEQLYTFGEVHRDPFGRVVSVAYFALIPNARVQLKTTQEYGEVAWFPVSDLPKLAYDHSKIIATALGRLKAKLEYTNIVYSLLPHEFTLRDLQKMYEIILGRTFDKRNFRKKIFSLKLVKATGKKQTGEANRPAELFRFVTRSLERAEIL